MGGLRIHRKECGRRPVSGRERRRLLAGTKTGARAFWGIILSAALVACLAGPSYAIENTASGSVGASILDTGSSTVVLNLVGEAVDPALSRVTVDPNNVTADGTSLSTITVVLRDADSQPVPGRTVILSSDRGGLDVIAQPLSPSDETGTVTGTIRSGTVGVSTITATETTIGVVLNDRPQVFFTQGFVLDLMKSADRKQETVGGVVTYTVEIRNLTAGDVGQVRIDDVIPPNFKYVRGSARLNGALLADPSGNRPVTFFIETVPALVDANGNGRADPGEQGYAALSYQLVIGSGSRPGDYTNTAVAWDVNPQFPISNRSESTVTVAMDPLFDLGTIIGKVFEDRDGDGWQDEGEGGVADATVVLDDGTRVVTDEYGRYHIPAVRPGHRMVKIDRQSLPAGAGIVGEDSGIVSVTPGLLAKVNFRVTQAQDIESVGSPPGMGLLVESRDSVEPVKVHGSVGMLQALVNGVNADLPGGDVVLGMQEVTEMVNIAGGDLQGPLRFRTRLDPRDNVKEWKLTVTDSEGMVVKALGGLETVPEQIIWSGITGDGDLIGGGRIYRYRMEVWYRDGGYCTSAVRTFGVNQRSFISLNLSGSGFDLGSATLHGRTEEVLADVARTLREHPNEAIIIEGHTDSEGTEEVNLRLSRQRAEAALDYLVEVQGLSPERFVLKWYGESRPAASNEIPEGREINRRVEIKGQLLEVNMSQLLDQYRTQPKVFIDGSPVDVGEDGRFQTSVGEVGQEGLRINMVSAAGAVTEGKIPIPDLEILDPRGEIRLGYGETGEAYRVGDPGPDGMWEAGERALTYRLKGRTDPVNTVMVDDETLSVDEGGVFTADLALAAGEVNTFGLVVRNPAGYIRIARLAVRVTDSEEDGTLVVVRDPVPNLSVQLPPEGAALFNSRLTVNGYTDRGNEVRVNGRGVTVMEDGGFTVEVDLTEGENQLRIQALDPDGHIGEVQRTVTLSKERLFFMAFADGKIGQLQGKGYLEGAGMKKDREFYHEGRVAYYLKGTVAGKYLVTSAFDSGTGRFSEMFEDLDEGDRERFFTNLDPNKYYPVYGDASSLTYDAESQGKFYLAVDSEELHLLVGNYALNLSDTELAAYQRTLYGGKAVYRSLARSKYGEHDTTVVLFGAQARDIHIRDELRATGGSLYYLSRREITEGSEQVSLVIRDKETGLILAEIPQGRNVDYQVRYEEGRLLFNRPIASVVQDDSLIDDAMLSGDPVSIRVDYEVQADSFERTSFGGRVRKQVGDNLSVGGTYIADELESGSYDLSGFDAKVRLGGNSWISAEVARSAGSDSPVFLSEDGGLTYTEVPAASMQDGEAFKAAAELDVGELFGAPQRLKVGGYVKRLEPGFQSSANHSEEGFQKYGADFSLVLSESDTVLGRYDRQENLDSGSTAPGVESDSRSGTLQWTHRRDRLRFTLEYRAGESHDSGGSLLDRSSLAAGRLDLIPNGKVAAHVEHQATLDGPENDQTTAGVRYQVSPALSLGATGTHGTMGESLQGEASLNAGDSRLYATERMTNDSAGRNSTTVLGAETAVDPSTKVYSENQWERPGRGADRQVSLLGVRRSWDLAPGLSAILSGEASRTESASEKSTRYTLSTGVSYRNTAGLEAKVRGEMRREKGSRERVQYLTSNRFRIMLSPDYSLLARYAYSQTRDLDLDEVEARFEERSIGMAYRPVTRDRLNFLLKYTQLIDQAPDVYDDVESRDTCTRVVSVEWSYDLTPRLEWVEKNALKELEEKTGDRSTVRTRTVLSIHRLNYNFLSTWELGVEYRLRSVDQADDRQVGWLGELMYGIGENFRIGLGYNFTDFSDNEFSENDYSVRGTFLRFQGKY